MRIALCDDQPEQLEQIYKLIFDWNNKPADLTVYCYDNGDALLQAYHTTPFDIIFLDVIMPQLGGMEIRCCRPIIRLLLISFFWM